MVNVVEPQQLRSELKEGVVRPVYLLAGADGFRAEATARWLRERAVDAQMGDFNSENLWADERSPAQIAEAACAYPMFGGRRFLWVRHAEKLPAGAALEPLLRYLARPSESTVLVLTAAKLDKRLRLTSACAEHGRVVEFSPLRGADLAAQVRRQASAHGVDLDAEAGRALVELVGDDLAEIDTELAKLALAGAEGQRLRADDVRRLVAASRDVDGFELADRLDASEPRPLLHAWVEMRRRGVDPFGNAAVLMWRLRQLVQLAAALDEGLDPREAGTRAGLAPWQVGRLIPLVDQQVRPSLQTALEAFRRADRLAKSSSLGAGPAYDLALLRWAAGATA